MSIQTRTGSKKTKTITIRRCSLAAAAAGGLFLKNLLNFHEKQSFFIENLTEFCRIFGKSVEISEICWNPGYFDILRKGKHDILIFGLYFDILIFGLYLI